VDRFYPSFTETAAKITLKHILTHSSGLPAHLPFYRDTKGEENVINKILQTPLEYEPGTKAVYSDLGIILLGNILEKVTGRPLDQLAQEQIFAPLGMSHTLFKPGAKLKAEIAPTEKDAWRGRLIQGEVHDENAFAMGGVSAHAGLFSNSGDLSIFCQMLLNGGIYAHHRVVAHFDRSLDKNFLRKQSRTDTPSPGSAPGKPAANIRAYRALPTSIWLDRLVNFHHS
jgi:CubicO group peptidase (beta-lactamase class C family)